MRGLGSLPTGGNILSLDFFFCFHAVKTRLSRYQLTDSSGKFTFTTTSMNVSIVKYRMSVVTILPLDFVMVH